MSTFADNLRQLPSIAHLAELQLIDATGATVAVSYTHLTLPTICSV